MLIPRSKRRNKVAGSLQNVIEGQSSSIKATVSSL
jgi:hypothetical protein